MRLYRASRRELFERLDLPALRPLPAEAFVYSDWRISARVSIDYHIELHGHYYSVPYALIHEYVVACLTAATVEIFHRGQRVAAHRGSFVRGHHTTDPAHMPKAHQRHLEWTPSRLIDWARTIGAQTAALVEAILADRPHPEQGYRSCLGILRLAKRFGPERLEPATGSARRPGYAHPGRGHRAARQSLPGPGRDRSPPGRSPREPPRGRQA
jgi:transposase